MKIRNGFVSNSSSQCFILDYRKDEVKELLTHLSANLPDDDVLFDDNYNWGSYLVFGLIVFMVPFWPILLIFIPIVISGYIINKILERIM